MNRVIHTEDEFISAIAKMGDDKIILTDLNFHQYGQVEITIGVNEHPEIMSTSGGGVFDTLVLQGESLGGQMSFMRLTGVCADKVVVGSNVSCSVIDCQIGTLHVLGRVVVKKSRLEILRARYSSSSSVSDSSITSYECDASAVVSVYNSHVMAQSLCASGRILLKECVIDGRRKGFARVSQLFGYNHQVVPSSVRIINCTALKCRR